MSYQAKTFPIALGLLAACLLPGCGDSGGQRMQARAAADALHAVIEADRAVYTRLVVNRLVEEEGVIEASEHWQDDRALPLPAQMLRHAAARVAESGSGVNYALLSEWPINDQNAPRTPAEKAGLKAILENPQQAFYTTETLGDREYFTAVYPDRAVAPACVRCHNAHPDSPRTDFEQGDVMGGVVIRLALPE